MSRNIRISVKAVLIHDGHILLTRHRDDHGVYFLLPGGGQRHGETVHDAIRRECHEETAIEPEVGRLLYIRDYIGRNHEFAEYDDDSHQVELMFECACDGRDGAMLGHAPDLRQEGVDWLPLESLADVRLYPQAVAVLLAEGVSKPSRECRPVYLGDVN